MSKRILQRLKMNIKKRISVTHSPKENIFKQISKNKKSTTWNSVFHSALAGWNEFSYYIRSTSLEKNFVWSCCEKYIIYIYTTQEEREFPVLQNNQTANMKMTTICLIVFVMDS